jgi:N-methylhydantoinase B/oxoprolinase/acetone carboxylase alpha subunit
MCWTIAADGERPPRRPGSKTRLLLRRYETIAGGAGARVRQFGLDGVRVHASGAANLPIEALENAYPLRVERYALRAGSGRAGRMFGGAGVVRDYRVLTEGLRVSLSSARQVRAAQGFAGGGEALCGSFLLNPDTTAERRLPAATVDLVLERGDLLRLLTPGGGGGGQWVSILPRQGHDNLSGHGAAPQSWASTSMSSTSTSSLIY